MKMSEKVREGGETRTGRHDNDEVQVCSALQDSFLIFVLAQNPLTSRIVEICLLYEKQRRTSQDDQHSNSDTDGIVYITHERTDRCAST